MKALSIRQPWADLIIQGIKTLELRSWTVSHRGPLAIHASQTIDEIACRVHGIDPRHVSTGVLVGVVELIDISALDEDSYKSLQMDHLSADAFKPPLFAWKMTHPKAIEKAVPYNGRMGLFNVPDELTEDMPPITEQQMPAEVVPEEELPTLDSRLPFELQVKIEAGTNPSLASYRLALFQRPIQTPLSQPGFTPLSSPQRRLVCELGGTALKAIADAVLEALRLNGYAATDLGIKRREPFLLMEESGVRLALIFLAIRPITKVVRIEEISRGIRAMTGEELYYWFAKCIGSGAANTWRGSTSDRAQRALRILLAEE